jgi:universal stress protein F
MQRGMADAPNESEMDVRRILVGLDGSPREEGVLDVAKDMATRFGAALVLFRAVSMPPEIPPEAWQNPALTVREFLERRARTALEVHQGLLPPAIKSRSAIEIVVAAPWQGICMCAKAHGANLIVIGSHGYGALDRLLGTTAARVVNHAPCSVIVVRPTEVPAPHTD